MRSCSRPTRPRRCESSGGSCAAAVGSCSPPGDYHRQPEGRPPQVPDHRPLLEAAGFRVDAYDTTDRWREYLDGTNEGLLAQAEALAAESGESVEAFRAGVMEMARTGEAM